MLHDDIEVEQHNDIEVEQPLAKEQKKTQKTVL